MRIVLTLTKSSAAAAKKRDEKSAEDKTLDYFKKKILAHLSALEEKERLKRSDLKKSLLTAELRSIAKGKAKGIGERSVYKDGSVWQKIAPNKWKCVRQARAYTTESKGAKIALAALKKKAANAKTTDELLDIVMFNVNRFTDDKGAVLPFVKDLKLEVDAAKKTFNLAAKTREYYRRFYDDPDVFNSGNEDYAKAIEACDKFIEQADENPLYKKILRRYAEQTGDFVTSDRERAAFAYALADLKIIDEFAKGEKPQEERGIKKFSEFTDSQKREKADAIKNNIVSEIKKDGVPYNQNGRFGDAAAEWLKNNPQGDAHTEIGEVLINKKSVIKDMHHGKKEDMYLKLQTLPAVKDVLEKGVYLGYESDFKGNPIDNHYFAGKIKYGGEEKIVFCRVREARGDDKNRFYVHEVFTEDEIKKEANHSVTDVGLPWANGKPLYKFILQEALNVKPEKAASSRRVEDAQEAKKALTDVVGFKEVDDSVDKIADELLVANVNQLIKLEDKFGVVHKSEARFCSKRLPRNSRAAAYVECDLYNPFKQEVSLCPSHYRNAKKRIATMKWDILSGHSMPADLTDEELAVYTVTHEYGHMLQYALTGKKMESERSNGLNYEDCITFFGGVASKCKGEIISIAKETNQDFSYERNISEYGDKNDAEFFAEVFANSQLSKPNELGKAMNEWLKRKGVVK